MSLLSPCEKSFNCYILNGLSIKNIIKLILYDNNVKLLKLSHRSIYDMFEVWDFDYWYLVWKHQEKQ